MWICHVLDMSCLENDPSGLCYAGMLIHFRSGMSIFLGKVMPKFPVNKGMICAT